ncbi:DNA alkylation repair protein [Streptomyces lincolnensis]|uniref:DNA alkylation repair protein n=1 Tax=Streptomyces lincolnensis TaxID=1915 RepID=UPI0037D5FFA9
MDATTAHLVDDLTTALREAGDPHTAEQTRRYLKSNLHHHGVRMPVIRTLVADAARTHGPLDHPRLLSCTRALWHPEVHETRIAAAVLLERHVHVLGAEDTALLEDLLRDSDTWALVDLLAGSVAGRLLLREPTALPTYRRWATEDTQWIRRSGILTFLVPLTDPGGFPHYWPPFTETAAPLLPDPRFFIRKALGWVLRQTSRTHPTEVYDWFLPRAPHASGTTVRETVRHLDPTRTEAILTAHRQQKPQARSF